MRIAHLTALSLSALALAATGTAMAGNGDNPAQPAPGPATGKAALGGAAAGVLPAGLPKKYVVLQSGLLAAPAGTQTRGHLACTPKTVPLGGGVLISSGSLLANVNSSFPNLGGWDADVNNGSSATTFRMFVVCGKAPKGYQVVQSADTTAFAGSQAQATATCPAGTVPFGGGGLSRSGNLNVNLNSTFPSGNGWRTDMNNATPDASQFVSFAVCAKQPKGYAIASGPTIDIAAGLSSLTEAFCPGASRPLGGGVVTFSTDVHANVNSTFASNADGWSVLVNNGGAFQTSESARVVCAGI